MEDKSHSLALAQEARWNSPISAEISQRHKETKTQDFKSVYFNLFLVIRPKFGYL